jgi:hypothetical protein
MDNLVIILFNFFFINIDIEYRLICQYLYKIIVMIFVQKNIEKDANKNVDVSHFVLKLDTIKMCVGVFIFVK